jgi:hypothetical protein
MHPRFSAPSTTPSQEIHPINYLSSIMEAASLARPRRHRPSAATAGAPHSSRPWDWEARLEAMHAARLFLVHRVGPLNVVLRGIGGSVYHVKAGPVKCCSCSEEGGHCGHLLFFLVKVLGLDGSDDLTWQQSYTDAEVDKLLVGGKGPIDSRRRTKLIPQRKGPRRCSRVPLQENECCPICLDVMVATDRSQELLFCRKGCGGNMHARCIHMLLEHGRQSGKKTVCPLCRSPWDEHSTSTKVTVCPQWQRICCRTCGVQVRGLFFRCLDCPPSSRDLCRRCFQTSSSCGGSSSLFATHTFVRGELRSDPPTWLPAFPPRQPPPRHILAGAEGRELTASDYAALLRLDEAGPSLHAHLLQKLPAAAESNRTFSCVLCQNNHVRLTPAEGKELPCGHCAHSSCLIAMILQDGPTMSCCPHDKQAVFEALHVRHRRKVVAAAAISTQTDAVANPAALANAPSGQATTNVGGGVMMESFSLKGQAIFAQRHRREIAPAVL